MGRFVAKGMVGLGKLAAAYRGETGMAANMPSCVSTDGCESYHTGLPWRATSVGTSTVKRDVASPW